MPWRAHSAQLRVASTGAGLAVSAALLFAALVSVTEARASARLHPAPVASASGAAAEAARVARYWTPARMRGTPPLDAKHGNAFATASFTPVAEATVPPFTVNGRVFVRQGDQEGFCSGTAINSPTRQLVLTAGHCVNSGPIGFRGGSVWSRFLEFVPAYDDGLAPLGAFVARHDAVYSPKQWVKHGNPDFDFGAFRTLPNASGQNVADAVGGGATIAVDQTRHQVFESFGYPEKARQLQRCESPYVGDDAFTYPLPGPPTVSIGCHWGPGASGGGWLIAAGTVINGLTSYGHRSDSRHTFGPYFSSKNVGRLVRGL